MKLLTSWLREYLPPLPVDDFQLAEDLTLRGIAVEGIHFVSRELGHIFEMDITTNRVDAMNHYGVAREAATIYGVALVPLNAALPAALPEAEGRPAIRIEAPELCGRMTTRILRDVTVGASSAPVSERFAALGYKQISHAVDASNYVLHAMGHPTHAFDLDKLRGNLIVRLARAGEKLTTLDGVERVLSPQDLVIADSERAVSLAGVMGGMDTSITSATRNVLIEAAWFDPDTVRRSSRRHGIHSDASHRFERGADFAAAPLASDLVAQIILRNGGSLAGALGDVRVPAAELRTVAREPIVFRVPQAARLLGATEADAPLDAKTITPILRSLGCSLAPADGDSYSVTLPAWRLDLQREVDLIEEVARVFGYNRFRNTLPAFAGTVTNVPSAAAERAVTEVLLAAGFHEAVSPTFCSREDAASFGVAPALAVAVENPLSDQAGLLRPTLLPGMAAMLAHNLNHGVASARLFEVGHVFSGDSAAGYPRVDEQASLAIGLVGSATASALHATGSAPFFLLKGVLEEVFARFHFRSLYFDNFAETPELQPSWLHPYRAARAVCDGMTLGWMGQMHPEEAQRRKLREPVYMAEISLARLFANPLRTPAARELSRFPAVERDFSFQLPDEVTWAAVAAALQQAAVPELTAWAPREVFRDSGDAAEKGKYALLVHTTFQAADRTLSEEDLQSGSERVIAAVRALGGVLRGV